MSTFASFLDNNFEIKSYLLMLLCYQFEIFKVYRRCTQSDSNGRVTNVIVFGG